MTRFATLITLLLALGASSTAATITGTIKDPSGLVVAGASVTAIGSSKASLQAVSDEQGRFHFDNVTPGSYTIQIGHEGFDPFERKITVADKPVDLTISLRLKTLTTSVQVSGRRSPLANSDPNYQALRGGKLNQVYRVENLTLKRDAGIFQFRSGSFSFLPPVLGRVTTGVFVGDGNFKLVPAFEIAAKRLHRIAGVDAADEDFTALVIYFTDDTFNEIKQHSEMADASPQRHEDAFKRVRHVLETRREPPSNLLRGALPLTFLERILNYEDIPNIEAELLAELYNPLQGGSYRAFLHGKKHADLRFVLHPRGAMPMLSAPEEVALVNYDPVSEDDGVWYLSHVIPELGKGTASSNEDKRLIAPEHYKIEILLGKDTIGGNSAGLAATADLRFHAIESGVRVVKFDLLPDFQVARVAWNGKDVPFIQESRKQDGSFYFEAPEPLVKDRVYNVTFEYAAGDIVRSVFTNPRAAWYPRLPGSTSRSTFDLTFHVPHGTTVVSVGKKVQQTQQGGMDIWQYVSDVPVGIAVFRYLPDAFIKLGTDEPTNTALGVYIDANSRGLAPPSRDNILIDAGNSLRVFNAWFGPPAYPGLSVLVGGGTDSFPGMVFANAVTLSGFSSVYTQAVVSSSGGRGGGRRMASAPGIPATARSFLDEAFSREISRQWWGNTLGPATFHDDWLSRGFANFSTSLYDLAAYLKPAEFREHWLRARELIIRKNRFGIRPNDAGPVWMGMLNDSYKTTNLGSLLSTFKGGFVLHMLRGIMFDATTGDSDFRKMMREYVKTFANQPVSTEQFKWMVEKHMKPSMDLADNKKMDWFFNEWVYGTELPSYSLEYSIENVRGGKPVLTGKLTQSGVSPKFAMAIPIYGEFDAKKIIVGSMAMYGNSTGEFKVTLPAMPKQILLNPNYDVLTDKQEVKRNK